VCRRVLGDGAEEVEGVADLDEAVVQFVDGFGVLVGIVVVELLRRLRWWCSRTSRTAPWMLIFLALAADRPSKVCSA
jgi:hypothetical protein